MLASETTTTASTSSPTPSFTCLACEIAFDDAEGQRMHYHSDHHRYNMKRRVAGLPPVNTQAYNGRVLDKRAEITHRASVRGLRCETCSKSYATENTYRSHLVSKKHKDSVRDHSGSADASSPHGASYVSLTAPLLSVSTGEETNDTPIQLTSRHGLFCPRVSFSLAMSLKHMSTAHSFFIPDVEYLVDLEGLVLHLADKLTTKNVCIFCNVDSREFRTLAAVRKHMVDKGHCKIGYEDEGDILEVLQYYDFSATFPEPLKRAVKQAATDGTNQIEINELEVGNERIEEDVEWESVGATSLDELQLFSPSFTFNNFNLQLILSSGSRVGHRSQRHFNPYHSTALSLRATTSKPKPVSHLANDPNSGAALVRQLVADKSTVLVPTRGGLGAFGNGRQSSESRRGEGCWEDHTGI